MYAAARPLLVTAGPTASPPLKSTAAKFQHPASHSPPTLAPTPAAPLQSALWALASTVIVLNMTFANHLIDQVRADNWGFYVIMGCLAWCVRVRARCGRLGAAAGPAQQAQHGRCHHPAACRNRILCAFTSYFVLCGPLLSPISCHSHPHPTVPPAPSPLAYLPLC